MKRLRTVALALLFPLSSWSAPLVAPARLDAALSGLVQRGELAGVSALVFENGKEAYFGAFGQADRDAERAMSRDVLAVIYSMTKPVIGVALMQLYEQGKFQLDDPVAKYLPEYANARVYVGDGPDGKPLTEPLKRPITIRDLGRHTAGFPEGRNHPPGLLRAYQAVHVNGWLADLAETSRRIASVPLAFQPGTQWMYGPSMDVQGRLVEVLSGQKLDVYLAEHIFKPLGMKSTRYVVKPTDADVLKLAPTYQRQLNPPNQGHLHRIPDTGAHAYNLGDWPLKGGSSGLVSTIDDYAQFARALLDGGVAPNGGRLLKAETIKLMATNALAPEVTQRSWLPTKGNVGFGINFAVRTAPPSNREDASGPVGEFFWDGAANTLFWVDPKHQIVGLLFTQLLPPGDPKLVKAIRDAVYADDAEASSANKPPRPAAAKP
ncbi:serine hydrolase domain-containing protein [Roseateles paludis]|uniref:Serine hydrolase domain-containing protein n=1 Tax=Roseateles paludis TaxID=3145238 RepID=A0ABV0G3V9_9BURK